MSCTRFSTLGACTRPERGPEKHLDISGVQTHHAHERIFVYQRSDDGHLLREVVAPHIPYPALGHALPVGLVGPVALLQLLSLQSGAVRKARLRSMAAQTGSVAADADEPITVLVVRVGPVRAEEVEVWFCVAES